jgi:predicted GNAT superfamily acetyltransferase
VPVPILAVTTHRGGILIGAFSGDRMIGFVYSCCRHQNGRPTQWSTCSVSSISFAATASPRAQAAAARARAGYGNTLIEWTTIRCRR